jgi:hypothetical protein
MTQGSPGALGPVNGNYEMNCLWFTGEPAGVLQSQDFENLSGVGVQLFVNITGVREGGAVKVRLIGKDPVSGTYFTILEGHLVNDVRFERMTVFPGAVYEEGHSISDILPRTWAVQAEITGDDTAVSGTVGASIRGV